jgi:mannosyltransferase OCH1-like enzyme
MLFYVILCYFMLFYVIEFYLFNKKNIYCKIIYMKKFPKNLYQVWYQGRDNITRKEFVINIKNWEMMNPNWNYQCLDNDGLEKACLEYSKDCYDLYKSMSIMHMKIDLARYVLIYLYGGIYADVDAYVLRPLDYSKYINKVIKTYEKKNKHVIGVSCCNTNLIESFFFVQNDKVMNNAIMISSPRNPCMKRFIDYIISTTIKTNYSSNFLQVQNTTGPIAFNNWFMNTCNLNDTELILFPPNVFEPCDMGNRNCILDKDTISIHLFEMSWISPFLRNIILFYYNIKPFIVPVIFIILFIYFTKRNKMIK